MQVTGFSPFPTLQTQRLVLRQLRMADAPALYTLRANEEVRKYLDRPRPASQQEIIALIEMIAANWQKEESLTWAISLSGEPHHLVGTIGFWRMQKEHFRAEIGYLLHPQFHRQGIMNEAITAVLDYGFRHMNLHSVEAHVNPDNAASIRLLEKSGFVREAYFRENYYYDGKFLDTAVYSLVSSSGATA